VNSLAAGETRRHPYLVPGDPERPTLLDVLGDARPLVLRLQGRAELRFACLRSVSIVGARGDRLRPARRPGDGGSTSRRSWAVISDGSYTTKPATTSQARSGCGSGAGLVICLASPPT
jgi:DNA processing protein